MVIKRMSISLQAQIINNNHYKVTAAWDRVRKVVIIWSVEIYDKVPKLAISPSQGCECRDLCVAAVVKYVK